MLAPAVPAQVETGPERFATLSVDWRAGRGEDSVVHEELPSSGTLIKANQLLRRHGQERCKLNAPVRIFQRGASLRLALTGQAGGLSYAERIAKAIGCQFFHRQTEYVSRQFVLAREGRPEKCWIVGIEHDWDAGVVQLPHWMLFQ
jgi:hypothetical protein